MPKTCNCCPYGFHIDRDFVQFCESLYNIAQLDKLKQKKRERRKEQITVESCLGLNTLPATLRSRDTCALVHNSQQKFSTEDPYLSDLDDVVSDFEDTWQKSLSRKTPICEKNSVCELYDFINEVSYSKNSNRNSWDHSNNLRNEESVSQAGCSLNRLCIEESSSVHDLVQNRPIPHSTENGLRDIDVTAGLASDTCSFVKIHRNFIEVPTDVLIKIRNEMAISLNHVKILEEQVKSIPFMQVKLSALSEEKKILLNKLNTILPYSDENDIKDAKRLHTQEFITSRHNSESHNKNLNSRADNLASPALASNLNDALKKKCFVDSKIISQMDIDENELCSTTITKIAGDKEVKHVGTLCSVLTRDVGVGHIQSKCKSTGVGEDSVSALPTCFRCSQEKKTKSVSLSSDSLESDSDSTYIAQNHLKPISRFPRKCLKSLSSPMNAKDTLITSSKQSLDAYTSTEYSMKHENTLTELQMNDIMLCTELKKNKLLRKNKATSCDFQRRSRAVQVSMHAKFDVDKKFTSDIAAQTPELFPSEVQLKASDKPTVIDGNSLINNSTCPNCSGLIIKHNLPNETSIFDPKHGKGLLKEASATYDQKFAFNSYCSKCELKQTETIGVGDYDINYLKCRFCEHMREIQNVKGQPILVRSVATDTSLDIGNSGGNMHICDKCSAAIHSVAQDFTSRNSEVTKPHGKSLPKLNIPVLKKEKSSNQYSKKPNISEIQTGLIPVLSKKSPVKTSESSSTAITITPTVCSKQDKPEPAAISPIHKEPSQNTPNRIDFKETTVNPFKVIPNKKIELNKEVNAACKVLTDYLQKPDRGSEKNTLTSINIIKKEWFQVANKRSADPHVIEGYLDAFEEMSRPLLQRIVNLADNNGNTAVHYAVSYSNFDVVSILVDSKVCDVNKQNKAGYTCIMLVALADIKNDVHNYVVQRLFQMGDINIKAKQNGQTALMLAVSRGKLETVKMLLEAGSEVNLQDNDGSTALMCASEHGHIDIVRILLSHPDCDPTILDADGSNALTIAMEAGHKDIGLLIYANMNFSRGSSPYSSLKQKRRSSSRSTPPPRTPTLRTPPSPSARSTSSLPSAFHFLN